MAEIDDAAGWAIGLTLRPDVGLRHIVGLSLATVPRAGSPIVWRQWTGNRRMAAVRSRANSFFFAFASLT